MADTYLPRRCRSCRYSAQVDVGLDCEMLWACLYILHRGSRRPCPSGEGCTAYERIETKKGGMRPWLDSTAGCDEG